MNKKNIKSNNQPKDVLLIPRREVKLVSDKDNPPTFLMVGRTNNYSKRLDGSSKENNTGLSSGIRSVIVYDDKIKSYIKIKGVNLFPTKKERKIGDGTSSGDAEYFAFIDGVPELLFNYVGIAPYAVKYFLKYGRIRKDSVKSFYDMGENAENYQVAKWSRENKMFFSVDRNSKMPDEYQDRRRHVDVLDIPYFKIKGDTRLDEIIYILTVNKEKSSKQKSINNLLQRLCENGAIAYCKSHVAGVELSYSHNIHTDVHIGNIVCYEDKEKIRSTIVDPPCIDTYDSGDMPDLEFLTDLFRSFEWDFWDDTLGSLPHVKFKNFTDEQRDLCTKAFYNGYHKFWNLVEKKNIPPMTKKEILSSIKEHTITKDELDHYIGDKVIYQ